MSALTVIGGARADQSYSDARGDGRSGPDIVGATVRHDSNGGLVFQTQTANFPAPNHVVSLYLDVDGDRTHETWLWAGRAWDETVWGVYVWNGREWVRRSVPSFRASGIGNQITDYRFNARALGLPSTFRFILVTQSVDFGSSGWQTVSWDRAPDSGSFQYEMTSSTPPPPPPPNNRVAITSFRKLPRVPVAGETFEVAVTVARVGRPGRWNGVVSCLARVGGRKVRLFASPDVGRATCRWNIPDNAAGKTLSGVISVNENGGPLATRTFRARVIGVGAHVSIEGGVATAPTRPIPGQRFYVAMGVAVEKGGQHRRIQRGSVTCNAVIGGRALRVVERLVRRDSGVRCGWLIPRGASGQMLFGEIRVRAEGGLLVHRFRKLVR